MKLLNPSSPGNTVEKVLFKDSANVKFYRCFVSDPDGAIVSTSDIDLTGAAFTPTGAVEPVLPAELDFEIKGIQNLAVTDAAAVNLTIPAGATGAAVQVQGGPIRFTIDGTAPTTTVGTRALNLASICLGTYAEDFIFDAAETAAFAAIAESGKTATLNVTFYGAV